MYEVIENRSDLFLVRNELVFEHHLVDVIIEAAHLEETHLNVKGKRVEGHGADEGDAGRHGVHDFEVAIQPQTFNDLFLDLINLIYFNNSNILCNSYFDPTF